MGVEVGCGGYCLGLVFGRLFPRTVYNECLKLGPSVRSCIVPPGPLLLVIDLLVVSQLE